MAEDTRKKQDPLWDEIYPQRAALHRSDLDDLDRIMWGGGGVPSPPGPGSDDDYSSEDDGNDDDDDGSDDAGGRISSPSSISGVSREEGGADRPSQEAGERTCTTNETSHRVEENCSAQHETNDDDDGEEEEESIRASCIAWKKRSGLGKYYQGYMHNAWEQRRVAVCGTEVRYYAIHAGEEGNKVVRGILDLVEERCSVGVVQPGSSGAPTEYEIDITSEDEDVRWKFCFDSKEVQMSFLEVLHDVQTEAGMIGEAVEDLDSDRFEHSFEAGDHIFRWEMIVFPPVIYPIQIHGIVLEAGRNCVIVADFGMTGYGKKEGSTFNHADDHNEADIQESLVAAYKKFRPKEDQRLNIVTMTDPKEIRKWTKANYGKSFADKKDKKKKRHVVLGKLTSFFGTPSKPKAKGAKRPAALSDNSVALSDDKQNKEANAKEQLGPPFEVKREQYSVSKPMVKDETGTFVGFHDSEHSDLHIDVETAKPTAAFADEKRAERGVDGQPIFDEPEWFDGKGNKQAEPTVFSIPSSRKGAEDNLPKSDPKKIVLARCNFLLEFGEQVLPPYHVFFSNSECIAVWCKTGRWSTLQTAVYLTTQSVAGAKSSTAAFLGVAAAHAFLAPVVALGGLVWVTAPMVILQKSREKWEDATMKLTDLFWAWAAPDIFVEAIENWSNLH